MPPFCNTDPKYPDDLLLNKAKAHKARTGAPALTAVQKGPAKRDTAARPYGAGERPTHVDGHCSPNQFGHVYQFSTMVWDQQLHHQLTSHQASSFLLFSSHRSRSKACCVFRGLSIVCQLFSIINVFDCLISNTLVSGEASPVHEATCPVKSEHHNEGRKGESLKRETQAHRLDK